MWVYVSYRFASLRGTAVLSEYKEACFGGCISFVVLCRLVSFPGRQQYCRKMKRKEAFLWVYVLHRFASVSGTPVMPDDEVKRGVFWCVCVLYRFACCVFGGGGGGGGSSVVAVAVVADVVVVVVVFSRMLAEFSCFSDSFTSSSVVIIMPPLFRVCPYLLADCCKYRWTRRGRISDGRPRPSERTSSTRRTFWRSGEF